MVGVLVGLKLRLLRNQLGRATQQVIGLAVLLGVVLLGAGAIAATVALSPMSRALAGDLAAIFGLALALGWLLLPVAATGVDATLDVGRLALLPITARRHGAGLFAAACVGIGPVASLVLLAGFVARAPGPGASLLALAAIAVHLSTCVLVGRVAVSGLAGMLRRRRARELAYTIGALATLAVGIGTQVLSRQAEAIDRDTTARLARVARAVPLNLGGRALSDALAGRLAAAALAIAGGAGLVAVLGGAWWALVARELTSSTVDATGPGRRRRGLRARSPVAAVAARELRYLWRHPVARTNTITSVFLAGMAVLPLRAGGGPGSVLGASAVVAAVGLSCLNVLGVDGRAAWSDAMATDLATVLRGKIVARALLAGALVGPAALVVASLGGGWAYLPAVPFLAGGGFGVIAGFGAFASVAVPVPFPDAAGGSPWRSSPGQGCVTSLLSMALFAAAGVACLPLVVGAAIGVVTNGWALATTAALAPAYGWLAWRVGLGAALARARGRTPELLAALMPS